MIIPFVPNANTPLVGEDGNITNEWRLYFDQLSNQLQVNLLTTYDELTTAEIASISSGERNGKFIYDTDAGTLKVGFNDAFATVTTT